MNTRAEIAEPATPEISTRRPVVTVRGLRKSYGDLEAVAGLDLDVREGEIFAFLGPNGAGKTITVEILEGFRRRTDGEVLVLGAPRRLRALSDRQRRPPCPAPRSMRRSPRRRPPPR
jgi:ABC-2 type transport system ATP-binding protein